MCTMNRIKIYHLRFEYLFISILLFISIVQKSFSQSRAEYLLTDNWKFTKGEIKGAQLFGFDDENWESVSIPHDWAIKGPFDLSNAVKQVQIDENIKSIKSGRTGGLPFTGVGWYRKRLNSSLFSMGQRAVLLFDGVMSYPKIYVNGKEAGKWAYGYTSFSIDITSFLKPGEANELAVRVVNVPESSRWYTGAGLYRNVHLIITDEIHIPVWGTYITTPEINEEYAKINIKTKISETKSAPSLISLITQIKNASGTIVSETTSILEETDNSQFEQQLVVKKPLLWSPETPNIYTAVSKLYFGQILKDQYTTTFGIRTLKFERGKGFFLNHKYRKFRGVCNHHDLGPLGAAVNVAALRRQLLMLKDMGCDAIRTSHNMPAPELVRLCNEMGFMLMIESFDEWKTPKVKNGYSQLFDEWAEKDMVNMIHRDRNDPSVVLWSIGNEVPDQSAINGNKLVTFLQDICHKEDPTRPVTIAMDRIKDVLDNNFAAAVDIPGFNYKPMWYEKANTKLAQGFVLGSETASTVSSRGTYKYPVELYKEKLYPDHQNSSYDLESCDWSTIPDDEFAKQDDLRYVLGEFVWTGFDYIGEPTPYDPKLSALSSYFGIIDLAGIPKDRYYLYRSRWNAEKSTLHLLPHWTFPGREGQITPVFCYTSYPSAELFVNGKSMGKLTKDSTSNINRYRLMWKNIKYRPGNIKVIAYDKNNKAMAHKTIYTAGKPHHIIAAADRQTVYSDGKDLSFITVKIVDKDGNLCPNADNELSFNISGEGKFIAVANGDPTSLQSFHVPRMKVFKGMLVVTVQSTKQVGEITCIIKDKSLKGKIIKIKTVKSDSAGLYVK